MEEQAKLRHQQITDLTNRRVNASQVGPNDYRETALAKLLELSRALVATYDPTEVLDQAVKAAVDIAPTADKGSLQLLTEDGETLRTVATSTPDESLQNTIAFRVGVGVAGHALQKNQTINVPDVLTDERFVVGNKPLRFRALLVAPLVVKGRLLGTLSLSSEQVAAFSPYHETLSQLIADQVAAALENARLFTRRLQTQQELQQSQQFLQAAIDALSAKITILDKIGQIIAVNAAWCRYLKTNHCTTPNYGLGANYLEVYATVTGLSPTEAATVAQGIQQVTDGEQADFYVEYPHYSPTQKRWDGIRITRFWINDIVYVVVAHEDVTERKSAEESLRESEEKFRSLTTQLPIGVYRTTETGQILYANPTLAKILGYDTVEELMTISSQETYHHPIERQLQINHWKESGGIVRNEIRLQTRSGNQIWVRDTGQAFFDDIGNMLYLDGTLEDITERKQAQEALEKSEANLRAIFDNSLQAFLLIDRNYEIQAFNRVVNELTKAVTGREMAEGVSILEYIPRRGLNQFKENMSRAFNGETVALEFDVKLLDDSDRWLEINYNPVFDHEGQVIGVCYSSLDITERKQATEAMAQNEARFRSLVQNSSDLITLLDAAGIIRYISPPVSRILGYSPEELMGQKLMAYIHPEDLTLPHEQLTPLMSDTDLATPTEFRLRHAQGQWVWMETVSNNLLDDPNIQGIVLNSRDITERKQTEEQLRLLAAAISSTEEGVMITDTHLDPPGPKIVFVNDGFCRLTGYSRTELIGQTPSILHGPKTAQTFSDRSKEILGQGQSFTGETINYRCDGSEYHVTWHISPVLDSAGQVTHYVSIQSDVTHLKRLETQFRQAQKMEAIGRLASGVAHDFNNLLTIIKSYTELIMLNVDQNDSAYQDLEQIKKASEKATGLTRQLLVFSRQQVVQPKMLNLNNVVTDMGKMLTRLIGEHIKLITNLDSNIGLVKADAGQIEQVIMNLVVNAVDAMPDGGELTIATTNAEFDKQYSSLRPTTLEPGSYVVLMVSDTGLGMDEETRSRIFEPFFTTKEQGKGTGLGLSTVYAIITQAEGDIWVYSEPGKGTSFNIYLPHIERHKVKTLVEPLKNKSSSTYNGTETILLVEDELSVRELTSRILAKHGYKVLAATDGHHALNIWEEFNEPIDLLLTDIIMPGGLNGRQLAEEITALQSQTRVIYMSGYTDDTVIKQEILAASAHFIQKPFTPLSLARKVREVLDTPPTA